MSLDKLHPEAPQNLTAVYDAEKMTVTVTADCPEGATSAKAYKDGRDFGTAYIVDGKVTKTFAEISEGDTHVYGLSVFFDDIESDIAEIEFTASSSNLVTALIPSREDIVVSVGARISIRIDPEPADAANAEEILNNLIATAEEPFIEINHRNAGIYDIDGIAAGETTAVFTSGDLSVSVPVVVTARDLEVI